MGLGRRALLAGALLPRLARAAAPVRVASKLDTESRLLGFLILHALRSGGVAVENRIGLGATAIVRAALLAGEIDIYPEYTGNGAFFFHMEENPVWHDASAGYALVKRLDSARNRIVWLTPAPADNAWSIAVRDDVARAHGLATMEDFARWVRRGGDVYLAGSAEFVESAAALPAFEAAYGFTLRPDQILMLVGGNSMMMLRAAAQGISGVNAAMTYSTSGALAVLKLAVMRDVKHAQLVFDPAPVLRAPILHAWPALPGLLDPVFAALDTATLRGLNARIEVDGEDASRVAADWLRALGKS